MSSIPTIPNPIHIEFIDPWDTYYQTNNIQTESCNSDDFYADAITLDNVEHLVSCSEQYHESFPIPHTTREDHQCSHTENANVNLQHTIIAEPHHISIRSNNSNDTSNDIGSISHNQQTSNELVDTSNHRINKNSIHTMSHDHSQANTSEFPSIGNAMIEIDEQELMGSDQNENYDGDIEDINDDETTNNCEEVGNYYR